MATYDGRVTPGGPAQTRDLGALTITKLAVDPQMSNNCYLLRCSETGAQVLVDAAAEAPRLLELIGPEGLDAVVTTHQHWDHHRALEDVVAATSPREVIAGEPDAEAIAEQTGVEVTRTLGDGDRIAVGACELEAIAIAGHTPGSVCLLYGESTGEPHLFTGDCLFPGGVGSTFGDSAAFDQLLAQVSGKIFDRLPDSTRFYPGHGDDGVLGDERPHLADWRERGW